MIMKTTKIKIYIDTNVVRDCTEGRDKDSIHLIETVRDLKIECVTSIFTLMELLDTKKDDIFFNKKLSQKMEINTIIRQRGNKDLNIYDFEELSNYISNKFFTTYSFIQPVNITRDESWDLALYISRNSNMSASDIIHLVTAWESKCNILVTNDSQFIKSAAELLKREKIKETQFKICQPVDALKAIKKIFRGYYK